MLCAQLDCQYAELSSWAGDAVLCTVLVCVRCGTSNQIKSLYIYIYLFRCWEICSSHIVYAKNIFFETQRRLPDIKKVRSPGNEVA